MAKTFLSIYNTAAAAARRVLVINNKGMNGENCNVPHGFIFFCAVTMEKYCVVICYITYTAEEESYEGFIVTTIIIVA